MRDSMLKRSLLRAYYSLERFLDTKYTDLYIKYSPISKKKIVFQSYLGKGFCDNPRYIAEALHHIDSSWDMVWLLSDKNTDLPSYIRPVTYGSNAAKRELSSASVIVDNTRCGLRTPKKKGQINLQTWHGGLGFKKVEGAVEDKLNDKYLIRAKQDGADCDGIISACGLQTEDYQKNFWLNSKAQILEFGQPRCDTMFKNNHLSIVEKVRNTLCIPQDCKIILYAPTFRDSGAINCYALDFQGILEAFEAKFQHKVVMVIRLHPNIQHMHNLISYNDRIINGSTYSDMQELYFAASALITDYSSSAFDFALLDKPVFQCMLDYEEYIQMRGLADVFYSCPFPKAYSNEELILNIEHFSLDEYMTSFYTFKNEIWKPFDDGHASEKTIQWIKEQLLSN